MAYLRKWMALLLAVSLLAACNATPSPDIPPLFVSQKPVDESRMLITVSVDEVQILKGVGDPIGKGELRFLIIGADTTGKSSGIYCPGDKPISVQTMQVIKSPCLFGANFDEQSVGNGVLFMFIALDEDKSSLPVDLSYEVALNGLAYGLEKLLEARKIVEGATSGPVAIGIDILVSYVGGKVKDWIQQADVIGSQGVYLSRSDNWKAGQQFDITSGDGGLRLVYRVTQSSSVHPPSKPQVSPSIASPTFISIQASPASQANVLKDPKDFANWYFTTLWTDRDYQNIWDNYLTATFQGHASPGGYQEFKDWWGSVDKIDIISIDVVQNDGKSAWIHVKLTFHLSDGRTLSNREYDYDLTFNSNRNTWMFDYHY